LSLAAFLDRFFQLKARGTNPWREIVAGITTFLTMGYVIFVHPDVLSQAGMDKEALITVTIVASALATLLAGLWANVPIAMAPGMGLNAFFAFSLVMGRGVPWETALGVVFLSGVFFLLLTILGIRARVVAAIPRHLRLAIASGIGLFITFIGLQRLGLIVADPGTLIAAGSLSLPVVLGLLGLVLMGVLEARGIRGAILGGILLTTLLGLILVDDVALPSHIFSSPPSMGPVFLQLDILGALSWGLAGAIISFMFVDLFDSVGTVMACAYEADMVKDDGDIEALDRILEADAAATLLGSLLGTSTTTAYIESGAGIAEGGRSGLANIVTAGLFLGALFLTPVIEMVPGFATAPALVVVGIYMFRSVGRIDFRKFEVAVPAFLTIVLMPLTYSISTGLAFGFLAHVVMAVATGKGRAVDPVLWIIGLFAALDLYLNLGP
jgi:AGZA family xanthine/uracil permease-like MFS transporter